MNKTNFFIRCVVFALLMGFILGFRSYDYEWFKTTMMYFGIWFCGSAVGNLSRDLWPIYPKEEK